MPPLQLQQSPARSRSTGLWPGQRLNINTMFSSVCAHSVDIDVVHALSGGRSLVPHHCHTVLAPLTRSPASSPETECYHSRIAVPHARPAKLINYCAAEAARIYVVSSLFKSRESVLPLFAQSCRHDLLNS
ncbi:hypothetical protein PoB_000353600 [Plakobranchus ocellatus]|uniref:Uncharacterized protein n=1 Tax=Plakobranchus ocellatus TaxID=259542 RepID=A0AAV3XJQ6_9GAST|nr:hypothetical protein PoB_000353600 [Plakobranchus ocellatus]